MSDLLQRDRRNSYEIQTSKAREVQVYEVWQQKIALSDERQYIRRNNRPTSGDYSQVLTGGEMDKTTKEYLQVFEKAKLLYPNQSFRIRDIGDGKWVVSVKGEETTLRTVVYIKPSKGDRNDRMG